MAYYSSNFYAGDNTGEYHWPPYNNSYDVVPYQASITYSAYDYHEPELIEYYPTCASEFHEPKLIEYYPSCASEFHEPKLIDYYPTSDNGYDSSEIHYSMYYSSEPKRIQYDSSDYLSSQTEYVISYSTSEFNEPEFLEYDPTPYGGGYDSTLTYGKPLPPSDEICYPRSMLASNGVSSDGFSYGSIPSPYAQVGTNDIPKKPVAEIKPPEFSEGESGNRTNVGDDSNQNIDPNPNVEDDNGKNVNTMELIEYSNEGEERGGNAHDYDYDYDYPWSGYDYECGNGRRGGGFEYEYEYELCESLFGHWPCLSKKYQRVNAHQDVDEESKSNPWKGTADYLFGNPLMNEGVSSTGSSNVQESYYQKQPFYGQQEYYEDNSWKQKFNIFEEM